MRSGYVKFIRFAEHLIEKTGEGVLGFITNHGYLDNPTFRGMRWHLLDTFDKIYVLDLHGNSKKKEVTPEGKPDKNVFDIQQGVSIIIGVKKKARNHKAIATQVFHSEIWGTREEKYATLWQGKKKIDWKVLTPSAPQFGLEPWDHSKSSVYESWFSTKDFFPVGGTGVSVRLQGLHLQIECG